MAAACTLPSFLLVKMIFAVTTLDMRD